MFRILLAAALMLPAVAVYAQDDTEALVESVDQVLYCATTFAILSVHPDAPEGAAAEYDTASTNLFASAYLTLTDGGLDEDAVKEAAASYTEVVTSDLTSGELRYTEDECKTEAETAAAALE